MAGRTTSWMAVVCAVAALSGLARADDTPSAEDLAFFESKVRPVLVEHCYRCHSADAKTLRGGLLLDTKAGWLKGGDSGPVIAPGQPDESLLIEAIRYGDPTTQMPPKGKLPDALIADLTEWVRRGAPDPRDGAAAPPAAKAVRTIDLAAERQHWSYQPLAKVEPPKVGDEAWGVTPIDRFVLEKLEAKNLRPSAQADRRVLIRRLYFDLIGLPPTPEEVDAFLADDRADAYERVVDRLLDDPRHGERWARHWLDLARFAESHGFEHDYDRPTAYHYRDFLIEALNRDLPYDKFVSWQLAGDELAPNDPLAMKATGFLAAGTHSTQITAALVEKERYDELDDMLNTTGTAFLGLTIGCARCHDHKYDPIPANDYYRMLATFTTTVRSEVDLDLDAEGYRTARAAYDAAHKPLADALAAYETEKLPASLAAWEAKRGNADAAQLAADYPWQVLDLLTTKSAGGATFTKQPDGSVLLSGNSPQHETLTFTARTDATNLTAVRLDALSDPSMTRGGPGRASNGNFALSDFQVVARPASGEGSPVTIKFRAARATFEQSGLPVAAAIDSDGTSAWAVDPQIGKDHSAIFEAEAPFGFAGGTELTITLRFANNLHHAIGRPRLALTSQTGAVPFDAPALAQTVGQALAIEPARRSPEQAAAVLAWFRPLDPEWAKLKAVVEEHAKQEPKPAIVKALVSTEGLPAVRLHTQGGDFLEKTHFLKRGDPNQKLGEASAGFLQVLMPGTDSESKWRLDPPEGWRTSYRRASLANWLTDTETGAGHLLARVVVNRLWQHHFGRGLVATPSDFGKQGSPPSHPELLDWLASELIRNGWRLKPIHKLMLMSRVYQQGGAPDPATLAADPENLLLGRRDPQRLEAESIRDTLLSVSGLLDPKMYGPGTLDQAMKRRSIYFTVKRSQLIPMMSLFDAPDGLTPIPARQTTTVAPQSLMLMNSPIVREWAEGYAARIRPAAEADLESGVRQAYRIGLNRQPTDSERDAALAFLAQARDSHSSAGRPDPLGAALADFCQVMFGLNEMIYAE